MAQKIPSKEFLNELFTYDEQTGLLHWRSARPRTKIKAGDVAGCELMISGEIRRVIHITGRNYLSSRLIAKMFIGIEDAEFTVPVDGNPRNTLLENILVKSVASIRQTQALPRKKSDMEGIKFRKGRYRPFIGSIHLGSFKDLDAAKAAREAAEIRLGFPERRTKPLAS